MRTDPGRLHAQPHTRNVVGGLLAMGVTYLIGTLLGPHVGL